MAKRKLNATEEGEEAAKRVKLDSSAQRDDGDDKDVLSAADAAMEQSSDGHEIQNLAAPKRASLLGLPAELRNRILDEILVPEEQCNGPDIRVTKSSHKMPAVLRTSRQLRAEGMEMFLTHNTLELTITDLKLEPHPQHWIFTKRKVDYVWIHAVGDCSRCYFKEWLYAFFQGMTKLRFKELDDAPFDVDIFRCAFHIVECLAAKGLEWSEVEDIVDHYIEGVQRASGMGSPRSLWDD